MKQPTLETMNSTINTLGIFWGKSLVRLDQWQITIEQIDQWVLLHDKFGLMSENVYFLYSNDPHKSPYCLRKLWGPTKRIQEHLQNNLDGWEAYVVNMDEGPLQGELKSFSWSWNQNVKMDWHSSLIVNFARV